MVTARERAGRARKGGPGKFDSVPRAAAPAKSSGGGGGSGGSQQLTTEELSGLGLQRDSGGGVSRISKSGSGSSGGSQQLSPNVKAELGLIPTEGKGGFDKISDAIKGTLAGTSGVTGAVREFINPGALAARQKLLNGEELSADEERLAYGVESELGLGGFSLGGTRLLGAKTAELTGKTASNFVKNYATSQIHNNPFILNVLQKLSNVITSRVTWGVAGGLTAGLFIADKILERTYGGKNLGEFVGIEEAAPSLLIVQGEAYRAGNVEVYDQMTEALQEVVSNGEYWDSYSSFTPWKNFAEGLQQYRDTLTIAIDGRKKLRDDLVRKIEEGETEAARWQRGRQEEREADALAHEQSIERLTIYNELEREARRQQRNEDAAFWAKQREIERKREAEERKRIADFWLAYRKAALALSSNFGKSNLTFGLL